MDLKQFVNYRIMIACTLSNGLRNGTPTKTLTLMKFQLHTVGNTNSRGGKAWSWARYPRLTMCETLSSIYLGKSFSLKTSLSNWKVYVVLHRRITLSISQRFIQSLNAINSLFFQAPSRNIDKCSNALIKCIFYCICVREFSELKLGA